MFYLYLKALHIIFVVTWFAGMFYVPRLFIYASEANEKPEPARTVLLDQLLLMTKRLWAIITVPSAIATLVLGTWTALLYGHADKWLLVKIGLVVLLYLYFFSLQVIYRQQQKKVFKYTGQQIRLWNEVPTVLLFGIIFLATVKDTLSLVWAAVGILCLMGALLLAIHLYKKARNKKR